MYVMNDTLISPPNRFVTLPTCYQLGLRNRWKDWYWFFFLVQSTNHWIEIYVQKYPTIAFLFMLYKKSETYSHEINIFKPTHVMYYCLGPTAYLE